MTTCHGFFKPKLGRKLFSVWGKKAIAISPAVAQHLERDLGVEKERIVTVLNGIELCKDQEITEKERADSREKYDCRDKKVIGIIARLSDVKGHLFLIEAMKDVKERIDNAVLFIVGQGKMEAQLHECVCSLGLKDTVRFYGEYDRTREFLSAFDVFVLPSLQEGLGLSVMEAQAAGLPVVASNVGGIPALIKQAQTGWLVAPRSAKELSSQLIEVLKDDQMAKKVGHAAAVFAQEHYSIQRMSDLVLAVYKDLIDEQS